MLLRRKGEPVFYKQAAAASTPNGRDRYELSPNRILIRGLASRTLRQICYSCGTVGWKAGAANKSSMSVANHDIVHSRQRPSNRPRNTRQPPRSTIMASIQHVHVKTRDPKQTAQFYVDNFGATMKAEIPGRGFRLDLHGLQLNITGLIASQNHEQHYGIEHIAVDTEDYDGTLARMRQNGVKILEEMPPNNGRRVCFIEAPDGAQMELIEKV
jgi:predicted enzyme related to lactoylglutathione lyase